MVDNNNTARWKFRGVLFLGILCCLVGMFVLYSTFKNVISSSCDFQQDYYAARHLLVGESIYSDVQYPNYHTPFDALLVIPFALLPYPVAIIFWSVLTVAIYLLLGFIVLRELKISIRFEWAIVLLGVGLFWHPFMMHLYLGQWSIIIALCITGAWWFSRRQHDGPAGILIGIATLIKLYPVLFVLLFLLRKRWNSLKSWVITVLVGSFLSIVLVGIKDNINYFTEIAPKDSIYYSVFPTNQSLNGIFGRLFKDGTWVKPVIQSPLLSYLLITICSLFFVIFLAWQLKHLSWDQNGDDISYGLTITILLLLSPITWVHMYTILMLPLGLIVYAITGGTNTEKHSNQKIRLLLIFVVALFSIPDGALARVLLSIYSPDRIPWLIGLSLSIPFIGELLIIYLLYHSGKVLGKKFINTREEEGFGEILSYPQLTHK